MHLLSLSALPLRHRAAQCTLARQVTALPLRLRAGPATHARHCLSTSASTPRPVHLLLYSYVDDALEKRQPFRAAHLARATTAAARGELLLGGALADPVDGGVLVFSGGADVASSFAKEDPYVVNGVVTSWTVREWTVVVGSLFSQLPPPPQLAPSYEWQTVAGALELPAGLEVQLPLDGGVKRARIPPSWRLQVWMGEQHGYLRHDVQRQTTAGELRKAVADLARVPPEAVRLRLGDDPKPLEDFLSVEALRLFGRDNDLTIEIDDTHEGK